MMKIDNDNAEMMRMMIMTAVIMTVEIMMKTAVMMMR